MLLVGYNRLMQKPVVFSACNTPGKHLLLNIVPVLVCKRFIISVPKNFL